MVGPLLLTGPKPQTAYPLAGTGGRTGRPFLMAPRGRRIVPFGQSQPAWRFVHGAERKVGRGGVGPVCGGGGGNK